VKDLVIPIPFPVERLADGVKNINVWFVSGEHYTCTPTSIYGRHIKSIIVAKLEFQPHEARNYSITTEASGWYKNLVETHELFKKVYVMQCERREKFAVLAITNSLIKNIRCHGFLMGDCEMCNPPF
jgi:hypothetical protein